MDKINTAYGIGGIDQLFQTIEYNLGVKPKHWILVHLDDFIHLIDELGGIDVPVSTPLPDDCGGIPPGMFHMDGLTALCYVRSRYSTSDFDRSRRQQEVLNVIFQRFISLDAFPQIPGWYTKYSSTIHSDLKLPEILQMIPLAVRLASSGAVYQYQISWEDVKGWKVPDSRAAVLLPLRDKISPKLQHAVDVVSSPIPTAVDPSSRLGDYPTGFGSRLPATSAP
jgi:LCP family protein required for cell wall assembly